MKTKKMKWVIGVALGMVGAASAATITWTPSVATTEGSYKQTLSAGLFNTGGLLVLAENAGGSATTFDGISFATGTSITALSGSYDKFHEQTPLSDTGSYGSGGSASTISLTGLTNGQEYRVQALLFDGRGDTGVSGRTVEFDGIDQGQYANGVKNNTYGDGMLVTGIFTADATTQDFTIEAFNADASSAGGQLNALTLYAIGLVDPAPPVWNNPIVVAKGVVGHSYSDTLAGQAIDLNGDPITFSLAPSTPNWLDVASDGSLTNLRELVESDLGTNDFNVIANDGVSGSSTGLLQLVVGNPLIEPIPTNAPSALQQAQIDRAYGMFCHFGINTFHNMEWTDGSKPASSYAPTAVDADQWVRTAYESGMRYFIMISKHHDGFCMWDSPFTTYDVGSSGNTTDVVRAVADACEKYGLSLAIYYSLWDRHESSYGSSAYIDYMEKQLNELLSNYGPVVELWLDGGWVEPSSYWEIPRIYDFVKQLQPDCQVAVNWSIGLPGNPDYHKVDPQDQVAGYPIRYFPSDFRLGDPKAPGFPDPKCFSHPDAIDPSNTNLWYYMPFESTVTLSAQNKWFHNTSDLNTKSLQSLERTFNLSTAQNNTLVLNSAPNRDGVLIDSNITALHDLATRLGLEPGRPIPNNVALNQSSSASSVWRDDPTYAANMAVDGNPDTRWASEENTPWLEIDLGQNATFDQIVINEYLDRVQSFKIELWDGVQWAVLANGTTIGESLRLDFSEVTASKVRLTILSASAEPSIWNFKAQFSNSAYRQWRETKFGAGSSTNLLARDTADPDGDSLSNIMEYVLADHDPLIPNSLPRAVPVSINGRDYIEYRLEKRPGVSPKSLELLFSSDLKTALWNVPEDSGNGDIVVEDTPDHWLLRMDVDLLEQGFFRARTTIW